jgi:bis(5'-nucleosyl)-tetraphosphatase (symmetrical)
MRTIFVGDVHGCLEELRALCDKLALFEDDTLVFLGDLVDRGPDPVGVVRFVRTLTGCTVKGILGNHEEKALRWLRHEEKVTSGKQAKNPMKPVRPERAAQWRGLDADDRKFLAAQPLVLEFNIGGEPWVAVHGGLLPGRPLADQVKKHASEIIRCRWVNAEGKHVGMEVVPVNDGKHVGKVVMSKEQPEGSFTWMERFDGKYHVVYGHAVHDKVTFAPRVDKTAAGFETWGIDTGCFGGGRLTALVLDHDRPGHRAIVQVQAARAYYPFDGDGEV